MSYGTKSPRKSRSPRTKKEMNRDISCVDDAEIFSRKSELEHMQEIRESAEDRLEKRLAQFFAGDGGSWD